MGNAIRGEVEFAVGKKVYTLCYSINAMCELESKLGDSIVAIGNLMADPTKLSIQKARTIFVSGMIEHHEAITEIEAGRIMTDLGLPTTVELVSKAMAQAFPEVDAKGPLPVKVDLSTGKAH